MNRIPTRTHTKDGVRMSAGNRRKCNARESRVSTLLELAQGYVAFWNGKAILGGLTYDGGFPSRLESRLPRKAETVDLLSKATKRATASFSLPGKARMAELEGRVLEGVTLEREGLHPAEVALEGESPQTLPLERGVEVIPSSAQPGGFEAKVRFGVGDVPGIYDPERKTFTLYLEDLRDPDLFLSGTYHLEAKRGNTGVPPELVPFIALGRSESEILSF